MRADKRSLFWLSADADTQNRLRLNRPRDSRFGVTVYPPPGQSVHTLTPACQRREQRDIARERTSSQADGEGFLTFLNKVHAAADSNKTVQLLSLLTQTHLSGTQEAW